METSNLLLGDLVAFHHVAESASFTRAAERLATSKSKVSKQIRQLEAQLGAQLLQRTTRTVSLTEQGRALFEYARRILGLSAEAERRVRQMSQGTSGTIKISTSVSLGSIFFPSILPGLTQALPHVRFESDLSNDNRDLADHRVDFAIRATDDHAPDLIARNLGRIRDVICATPAFAKQAKLGRDPLALNGVECILSGAEEPWNTWKLKSRVREVSIEARGRLSTNLYESARALCLRGLGVARVPYYLVSEDLREKRLIQLFPDFGITTHPLYLVYSKLDYPTEKHRVVKQAILAWFNDHAGGFVR